MKAIGIVCEWNPLHLGHQALMQSARSFAASGGEETCILCAMSGDFVQRGSASVFNKFARARAAVCGGADLVVELPPAWSLSSADRFAGGGVFLLDALGCEILAFGSECGNAELLHETAALLLQPEVEERVRREQRLHPQQSYASLRAGILYELSGTMGTSLDLTGPNNILALEYCKAICQQQSRMQLFTIRRVGSAHDSTDPCGILSGAAVRSLIENGQPFRQHVPETAFPVYHQELLCGRTVDPDRLELAVLSRLRQLKGEDGDWILENDPGLRERFLKAAASAESLPQLMETVKTKRYPMARIRRLILTAALGMKRSDEIPLPPYARILALNARGAAYLHERKEKIRLPVISKPADMLSLSPESQSCCRQTSAAHDLFVLSYRAIDRRIGGQDLRTSPNIIEM